jgi:hypothetical protein
MVAVGITPGALLGLLDHFEEVFQDLEILAVHSATLLKKQTISQSLPSGRPQAGLTGVPEALRAERLEL